MAHVNEDVTMYLDTEQVFGGSTKLFELIYSAVDDVSLWPVVLDQVAEAVQGQETVLFTGFPEPTTPNVSCLARMAPETLSPYVDYYASVNVLASACDQMFRDGTVRYSHRAVPDTEFQKTEFYNDCFVPPQHALQLRPQSYRRQSRCHRPISPACAQNQKASLRIAKALPSKRLCRICSVH
jgi:hypothetical protein